MKEIYLVVTDVGEREMTPEERELFIRARKRQNGRVDKRTREGRMVTAMEKQACKDMLRRHFAETDH